jgi:L-galactose dehydrogenase
MAMGKWDHEVAAVPDCAVVLPHDDSAVRIEADGHCEHVNGQAVIFVPPGDSSITATADTELARVFTSGNDTAALAHKPASRATPLRSPGGAPCSARRSVLLVDPGDKTVMENVRLGRTGLEVSVGCLGTGGHSRLGQAYGASFEESVDVVRTAIDLGVNFIDTAAGYKTEEIVGKAIKGHREDLVISTKNHILQEGSPYTGTNYISGVEFQKRVDQSLSRLDTEYIDVLHLHGICPHQYDFCVSEMVPALEQLRDQGKIRSTAISERFYVDPCHELLERALRDDYFDVMMVAVNWLNQSALRHVIPTAKQKDVGIQAIYAVRGKLATPETAREAIGEAVANGEVDPKDLDSDPLAFILAEGVSSLTEACYRFSRHAPGVDTVLTGTGHIGHLRDNISAIDMPPLPEDVLARLTQLFGRVRLVTLED